MKTRDELEREALKLGAAYVNEQKVLGRLMREANDLDQKLEKLRDELNATLIIRQMLIEEEMPEQEAIVEVARTAAEAADQRARGVRFTFNWLAGDHEVFGDTEYKGKLRDITGEFSGSWEDDK